MATAVLAVRLRAIYEHNLQNDFKVVAINASGDLATNAHLLKYDTTRPFSGRHRPDEENLHHRRQEDPVLLHRNPAELPWKALAWTWCWNAPVPSPARPRPAPRCRRQAVLISAPGGDDVTPPSSRREPNALTSAMTVVSNASCTTNCLAPVAKA
jgi:glyceraldehyde 3-phosphate dehydrogenase